MRISTATILFAATVGAVLLIAAGPVLGQWSSAPSSPLYGSPYAPSPGFGSSRMGGHQGLGRPPLRKAKETPKRTLTERPVPANQPMGPGDIPVVEVRIEGNKIYKKDQILRYIHTRAGSGRKYNALLVAQDVRRLSDSGMFVYVEPSTKIVRGGCVVIFKVIEQPMLTEVIFVRKKDNSVWENLFTSEKKKEEKLREVAGLKPGDPADPCRVEEARHALEEYYRQEKGFFQVRVTVREGDKPEDRRAVFVINEGPKQKIAWTQFKGNTIASDSKLRTLIELKQGILWTFKGDFDRRKITTDEDTLVAYYRSLGFFQARVGHEITYSRIPYVWSEPSPVITYVIDEGPRWKIRNVSFVGNGKLPEGALRDSVKLGVNDYFNQKKMQADIRAIREAYGAKGYIFTQVKAEPRFHEEPGELDLVYGITEGDRYRVGRIIPSILGDNPHTKITVLLNQTSLRPGDIIDTREVIESERRFRFSRIFESQMGPPPKIVFSPNEAVDIEQAPHEQIARPSRTGGFRGQSPDRNVPTRRLARRSPHDFRPSDWPSAPSATTPRPYHQDGGAR